MISPLSGITSTIDSKFFLISFEERGLQRTATFTHSLSVMQHLINLNVCIISLSQKQRERRQQFYMQPSLDSQQRREQAADKIQKLWRSYTNRKIYKYYRDIIMFKCKGNPAKLLKGINPLEAQLLETAVDCHVRFRLGGDTFPPNIYYKVFSKTNVCDINAFAPRDYASLPREVGKQQKIKFTTYQLNRKQYQNQGWYLRNDNNGWRPISHKMFIKTDYVELYSAKKVHFYHHKKQLRDEKYYKKQRLAKLKWLKNIYTKGKQTQQAELIGQIEKAEESGQGRDLAKAINQQKEVVENKLNNRQFDIESEQMDELLEWTQNLNFDSYVKDWYLLSTSQSTKDFVPKFVNDPSNYNVLT